MTREELIAEREAEKQRLSEAVDAFAEEMKARLSQKVDEGYKGWDDPRWIIELGSRLRDEARQLVTAELPHRKRKAVDLANFALMYWNIHDKWPEVWP